MMATIIEFNAIRDALRDSTTDNRDVSDGKTGHSGTKSAQVIFFPGIRIERYDIDPFIDDDATSTREQAKTSKR